MGITVLGAERERKRQRFHRRRRTRSASVSPRSRTSAQAAVELIIAAREKDGPFRDLHDLCARVESRGMNKKLLESLVKSRRVRRLRPEPRGAADADRRRAGPGQREGPRPRCRPGLAARSARPDGAGREENRTAPAKANGVPDFSLRERLGYEKELLGFYITGHPLDDYAADVAAFQIHTVAQLKEIAGRDRHARLRPRHEGRSAHHARRTRSRGRA